MHLLRPRAASRPETPTPATDRAGPGKSQVAHGREVHPAPADAGGGPAPYDRGEGRGGRGLSGSIPTAPVGYPRRVFRT